MHGIRNVKKYDEKWIPKTHLKTNDRKQSVLDGDFPRSPRTSLAL